MICAFPRHRRRRLDASTAAIVAMLVSAPLLVSAPSALATPSNVNLTPSGAPSAYVPAGPNPATIPYTMSQCAQYRFCGWQDGGYSGIFWNVGGSNSTWQYVGNGYNDIISSLWNRRTNSSWVNKDSPGGGDYACLGGANGGSPGWYYNNLKGNSWEQDGSDANDTVSSFWIPNNEYNNCSGHPQFHFK